MLTEVVWSHINLFPALNNGDILNFEIIQNYVKWFFSSHFNTKADTCYCQDYCIYLCGLWFELCWKVNFSI